METKDSNKSSFARVRVQESQSSESPVLSSRSQYLKLLYPNGVALILPINIAPQLLGQYIHASD